MNSPIERIVPIEADRRRLDHFLTDAGLGFSRSKVQGLIKNGAVTVNARLVQKPGYLVGSQDHIVLRQPEPPPPSTIPEDIPLDIIYEDEDLLVVNKPAGMVVHPACGHWSSTLVNALLHHCVRLSSVGDTVRPGIVHRLDKDTSGLLVVAKRDEIHHMLAAQLAEHRITRRYSAVVWGAPRERNGTITAPIGRHPRDRKRMAVVDEGKGRAATTHYTVAESFTFCSLLELRLETGRTHQIRVHLAFRGHPVFGDAVYGGRHKRMGSLPPADRRRARALLEILPRQALHAENLTFPHPRTGETMAFHAPPPEDMHTVLNLLRKSR